MPKLTVILTSYNRPKQLHNAISSVLNQSFQDFELIICDDNSERPEVKQLLKAVTLDQRVTVIVGDKYTPDQKENEILSAGRLLNTAIGMSSRKYHMSKYVTYLGDGTEYLPDRCERMINYLDKHPKCMLMWGHQHTLSYNMNGHLSQIPPDYAQGAEKDREVHCGKKLIERLQEYNFIDFASTMERRNAVKWSENPVHWSCWDWERWRRLAATNMEFHFIPILGEMKYSWPNNLGRAESISKAVEDRSSED